MKPKSDQIIEYLRNAPQAVAAWVCGMSPRSFRDKHLPRNPDGSYDVREIIKTLIQASDDAEMLSAPSDSPAMERWRAARALDAEITVFRKLDEIESTAVLWQQASEILSLCRLFAEKMIRDYGSAVEEEWSETVSQTQSIMAKYFPDMAKKRTLQVELEDGTILSLPLPLNNK